MQKCLDSKWKLRQEPVCDPCFTVVSIRVIEGQKMLDGDRVILFPSAQPQKETPAENLHSAPVQRTRQTVKSQSQIL